MRVGRFGPLAAVLACAAGCASATGKPAGTIDADIAFLTSPDRGGRGPESQGRADARDYIVAALRAAGLEPLFGDAYTQSFLGADGTEWVNVGGVRSGDVPEHLIVGAHYDHLATEEGIAGPVVYPGADDNASGVAVLLDLARTLPADASGRSVAFVAFDGEEQGLLGSEHYVADPPLELTSLVAMINLDSVGRLRNDRLVVFGSGTATVFTDMLKGLDRAYGFDLALNPEGVGAGDHETFFRRGIPVLHLFTDAHLDYHRPSDTPDKLNMAGIGRISAMTADMITYLRDPGVRLEFVPAGADKLREEGEAPVRRRVRLGTIPDFAREAGGVRITGLVPDSPASRAGLLVGDIIVRIDDVAIDNLYDYQTVLASRAPGDVIAITVRRDDETIDVKATLEERTH